MRNVALTEVMLTTVLQLAEASIGCMKITNRSYDLLTDIVNRATDVPLALASSDRGLSPSAICVRYACSRTTPGMVRNGLM